jgi:hypothetical protein
MVEMVALAEAEQEEVEFLELAERVLLDKEIMEGKVQILTYLLAVEVEQVKLGRMELELTLRAQQEEMVFLLQ